MVPLSIAVDQEWHGDDGPWSTFQIRVGTPEQVVHIVVSFSLSYLAVCNTTLQTCQSVLGGGFSFTQSSTWQYLGIFQVPDPQVYQSLSNEAFGWDNITLGANGSSGPSLGRQLISDSLSNPPGTLGLRLDTTLQTPGNGSLLQNLKIAGEIPSLSWAYTAGSYQMQQVNKYSYGSLTIGGYDDTRFQPNNVSFPIIIDDSTGLDLKVTLLQIELASSATPRNYSVIGTEPIPIYLDPTGSLTWLPEDYCQSFVSSFNLIYDSRSGLYFVNDTVYQQSLLQNLTVSFLLSLIEASNQVVQIDVPYSSLLLQYVDGQNSTRHYLPIAQAGDTEPWVLGRAFFQHAYVIVDYERSNFSIHNAVFPTNGRQSLQPIYPVAIGNNSTTTHSSATSTGTVSAIEGPEFAGPVIAGLVIGISTVVMAILAAGCFFRRRRRKARQQNIDQQVIKTELDNQSAPTRGDVELHAEHQPAEIRGTARDELTAEEVANKMAADIPPRHEMEG